MDIEANERNLSNVLAIMTALLLAAAVLNYCCSQLRGDHRIAIVAGLFAFILAGYVGGA